MVHKSKKLRGESSAPAPTYDQTKFVSEEASQRFFRVIDTKNIIPERGFRPDSDGAQAQLYEMVRKRNWTFFTEQPEPAVESVVREFYANAGEAKRNKAWVRGKKVSFSAEAINEFYGLDNESGDDEYTMFKRSKSNLDELLSDLCRPNTTWTFRGATRLYFRSSALSKYGKAWYYFLCAKLLPTTHLSEIIKERAILLHCLVKGKSINVGRVILGSIRHAMESGSKSGLPHPSLICELCQQAGVVWDEFELTLPPKALLDDRIIEQLKQWGGRPAHPEGAGFLLDSTTLEAPRLQAPTPADLSDEDGTAAPSPSAALTENQFSIKLRRLHSYMDDQFQDIARQNKRLAKRQDAMYESLSAQMAHLRAGESSSSMPQPRPLPVYPPPPHSDDEMVVDD